MDVKDVTAAATRSSVTAGRGLAGLRPEDFFMLLIAELQHQDPFEPMDNAKMVEQISSIRDIELSTSLSAALESVTKQQNYATAASLIGKLVTGTVTDASGQEQAIEGIVVGVRLEENGKIVLELDTGDQLPLEAVTHITNPSEPARTDEGAAT